MICNFNVIKKILAALLLIAFSACAVGPNYHRPESKIPKQIKSPKIANISDQKLNIRWWESFQDPILNQLVLKGVAANKSVKQALSRVNQSRALARVAFAELLPGFQFNSSYEERQISGVQFGGKANKYDLYRSSLDAAWEIDIFGRLRRNLEASNADYEAKVAGLDDSIQILLSELANNYFQLRSAQQQLAIAKNNLKLQQETVRIVEAKLKAGSIGELDLARANSQLAQTSSTVAPLKAMVKSYIYRISVLCSKSPTRFTKLLRKVDAVPVYQGSVQIGQVEDILQRRPDIRSAERMLAEYNAIIGVETGQLFPKIKLTGFFGYENTKGHGLFNSNREVYGYGPTITWSPFDLGTIRSKIKSADARAEEALYFYEETVLKALEDLKNSFNNYQAQSARTYYLQTAFDSSKRAYQLAQAQYQVGSIDLLSVLDAQTQMLSTENELAVNQQSQATAIVNIYKALGGGWEAWEMVEKK